jgi:hypothetical protein
MIFKSFKKKWQQQPNLYSKNCIYWPYRAWKKFPTLVSNAHILANEFICKYTNLHKSNSKVKWLYRGFLTVNRWPISPKNDLDYSGNTWTCCACHKTLVLNPDLTDFPWRMLSQLKPETIKISGLFVISHPRVMMS